MSKHTPGPFSARYEDAITVRDKDDNQLAICTHMLTKTGGRRDTNEVEKNAKLFAAAPELLEAAKLVLAWYEAEEDFSKEPDFYKRVAMCKESEDAIRAAIAKATGEQA